MSSSRAKNGNVLPTIINPPRRCITFDIPDEPQHVAAFFGALLQLAYWFNWQRDDDHTGKDVAAVWQEVFNQASLNWLSHECGGITKFSEGVSTEMSIRQNPDNPCLLESSLDGVDWCVFADLSKCSNFGTQPGTGTTQPPAGGGTQQTCKALPANGTLLLPLTVNTGDTILLQSANGAGWDGGEFDFGPLWRLPNGNQYVGGIDVGFHHTDSGDPVPTENHMSIIAAIGPTPIYVALPEGTSVTVPSGISNAQVYLQVNDSAIGNNQGSYDVCVKVTNNQQKQWIHVFDFTLSPYSQYFTFPTHAYLNGPLGTYVPGVGYVGAYQTDIDGKGYNGIYIALNEVINYQEARSDFSITAGAYISVHTNFSFEYNYYPGPTSHNQVMLPAIATSPQIDGAPISATNLEIQLLSGLRDDGVDPGGSSVLSRLTIFGQGTDPFV